MTDTEKEFYEKGFLSGFSSAKELILANYIEHHDVYKMSQVEEISKFIMLSPDEIINLMKKWDRSAKQEIYDRVSKETKSREDMIYALWKNHFRFNDLEDFGFSKDETTPVIERRMHEEYGWR